MWSVPPLRIPPDNAHEVAWEVTFQKLPKRSKGTPPLSLDTRDFGHY